MTVTELPLVDPAPVTIDVEPEEEELAEDKVDEVAEAAEVEDADVEVEVVTGPPEPS